MFILHSFHCVRKLLLLFFIFYFLVIIGTIEVFNECFMNMAHVLSNFRVLVQNFNFVLQLWTGLNESLIGAGEC